MRVGQALGQKQERVLQLRMRFALERFGDVLHRDVSRDFAVQMAAHAVGEHHQQRVARIAVRDAVLIGGAAPRPAFLIDGEFHLAMRLRTRMRSASSQLVRGTRCARSASAFCSPNTLCGRSRWSSRMHQSMVSRSCCEYCPPQRLTAGATSSFLTLWSAAYAHNDQVLVKEGQTVARGQK